VQTHDYNPGYWGGWPDGIFWTIAVPNPTVEIQPELGRARWRMEDLEIRDYFDAGNAFANGPTLPGRVSFEVSWMKHPDGTSKRYQYEHEETPDEPDSYRVDYWDTAATLAWTGVTPEMGFSCRFDEPAGQSFAVVGREHSGAFFDQPLPGAHG
jgi:hypothetical protein